MSAVHFIVVAQRSIVALSADSLLGEAGLLLIREVLYRPRDASTIQKLSMWTAAGAHLHAAHCANLSVRFLGEPNIA